jgi:hypothetical protein
MKSRRHRNRRNSRRRSRGSRLGAGTWNRTIGIEPLEPRMLLNVDLSGLNGSDGFTFSGTTRFGELGSSVRPAGDFNGDGYDDVIIGSPLAGPGVEPTSEGHAYVLFGGPGAFDADLNSAALNGTNGFYIEGAAAGDRLGTSVGGAGDVNGDGLADIIVGAEGASPGGDVEAGAAYVIFGTSSAITSPFSPNSLNGTNGFALLGGNAGDNVGSSVQSAGDMNGDGFDDVVVGARSSSPGGINLSGSAYVVFGQAGGFAESLSLPTVNGTNGFLIQGAGATSQLGASVAGAGDVNGDGFDDVILGAAFADRSGNDNTGRAFLVFGRSGFSPTLDLITLNGANGLTLDGDTAEGLAGFDVSGAGDVNGDGFDDVIVGAPWANTSPNVNAGAGYLVYGKANFGPGINLGTLNGTNGTAITGIAEGDTLGRGVGGAGDVNGDGFDDVIVRVRYFQESPHEAYIVFGKSGGLGAQFSVDLITGTNGLVIDGIGVEEQFPTSETANLAGDLNGDGFDDFIIGAVWWATGEGTQVGRAYIVFGDDFSNVVTEHADPPDGPPPVDLTLNGTAGADILVGNRGDDTALGSGGEDVLRGGAGDDKLEVGDLNFRRVVGGHGHDTLVLDNTVGTELDLTARPDNRIVGIEAIDITGDSVDNTLVLDDQEVLRISRDRNLQGHANTLLIIGDTGDVVRLPAGWSNTVQDEPIGPTLRFDTYTSGTAAVVKVSTEVTVERLPFIGRFDVALVGNTINPTTVFDDPNTGEVIVPPQSEVWVDDWDTISVEVFVSNNDASGVPIGSASFDVTFNPNYFAFDSVEYGPAFDEAAPPNVNPVTGLITGVSAVANRGDAGDEHAALAARVVLRPITDNDHPGVPHNADGAYVTSEPDLNVTVINALMTPFGGGDAVEPVPYDQPSTDVWPMIFDINDNGLTDLGDLSVLAAAFGERADDVPPPSPFFWQADFNHDGEANFGDLSWLATNFNKGPEDFILYPTNFPQAWLPSLHVAADLPAPADDAAPLTQPLIEATLIEATHRIETALGSEAGDAVRGVTVEITDLAGDQLGAAGHNVVLVDVDAAGYGWFVDTTPWDDAEFTTTNAPHQLQASEGPAADRVDLLTVIIHELVHTLGYHDTDGDDLMGALLPLGTRRLLTTDLAFADGGGAEDANGSPSNTDALDGAFAGL